MPGRHLRRRDITTKIFEKNCAREEERHRWNVPRTQQFELGKSQRLRYEASGRFAFLLWKSVYVTKQVSFRNRVLILFDWMKTRVFGRDTSIF
ncbi:predicted protein [Micromonas commoda]|uniref:NADH:ubiquinone reductase (non-electrogenic) n=1 Tax=Micromonas commoda (strain RCC299 / NOUM17 / CCMP2709) TaxID=296587 RepID=C1E8F5_MICCC|nr:predicted protein [Micromonas commoda]ACO64504.1 predicted protein [Micromonas commoda]|eukprot:XP_002503246.1 predicted protein [Micromonas commoda]